VTNLLNDKYLVRGALRDVAWGVVVAALLTACGAKKPAEPPKPVATAPLPTAGIAGQRVSLFPLTLVAAEDTLHWGALLADRRAALDRSDSIIESLLVGRAPEVTWVRPADLRRAARRAAGIAANPDQMGTSFLRAEGLVDVPDPLRYELRTLVGLAGGRFAFVPAGLVFRRTAGQPVAELSVVLVDTRIGKVGWRTVARGEGDDPWTALTRAVKALTPGLP
jgi:hypothetical protein